MSIFRVALELFALYIVYKLVFDLIIPVAQTTKKVKKQFGEMQERMNQQGNQFSQPQANNQYNTQPNEKAQRPKSDDYIEFEEIK